MLDYNLLHARNEIAHNNRMMLQASGTLGIMMIYRNQKEKENIASIFTKIAEESDGLRFQALTLEEAEPGQLNSYILNNELEQAHLLMMYLPYDQSLDLDECFIGQEYTFNLQDELILSVDQPGLSFNISKEPGIQNWKTWLLSNISTLEIEYYDPDEN